MSTSYLSIIATTIISCLWLLGKCLIIEVYKGILVEAILSATILIP